MNRIEVKLNVINWLKSENRLDIFFSFKRYETDIISEAIFIDATDCMTDTITFIKITRSTIK